MCNLVSLGINEHFKQCLCPKWRPSRTKFFNAESSKFNGVGVGSHVLSRFVLDRDDCVSTLVEYGGIFSGWCDFCS